MTNKVYDRVAPFIDWDMMTIPNKVNNLLTQSGLARMLGQSRSTIKNWDLQGITPGATCVINGWRYWHREDILEWIRAGCPTRERWDAERVLAKMRR